MEPVREPTLFEAGRGETPRRGKEASKQWMFDVVAKAGMYTTLLAHMATLRVCEQTMDYTHVPSRGDRAEVLLCGDIPPFAFEEPHI